MPLLAQPPVKFIENKQPDMSLVTSLLSECAAQNQWANFGPLYHRLADEYAQFMQLSDDVAVVPCANAGLGLELQARLMAAQAGVSQIRWVGPSLSFRNLGRGYFSDMTVLDCDALGVLDLSLVKTLPLDSYDGLVVVNPFGMSRDFDGLIAFAKANEKKLLIDNAAGIDRTVPDWPWQVFSLHQTKPYGMGEGGMIIVPRGERDQLVDLMNYGHAPEDPALWLNNCKISDIACAFHLARLQTVKNWESLYRDQCARIEGLFAKLGVCPLHNPERAPLVTSLPFLMPDVVDLERLVAPRQIPVARQYTPLGSNKHATWLHERLINFPSHPDMSQLSDDRILCDIEELLTCYGPKGEDLA